jgi:hypothetical protein
VDYLAGDVPRLGGGEERDHSGDVLGYAGLAALTPQQRDDLSATLRVLLASLTDRAPAAG